MNVIAIISEPDKPNPLTESNYNRITQRSYPYVQSPKGQLNSYALCPECGNAVVLINKARTETQAEVLYARHVTYDVPDLANYDEQAYDDCILANPVNMDNKVRRRPGKKTNQIKQIFMNYFDLIVNTLETNLGVQFSDEVIENMVSDFCLNRGYEYRSVSVFNLPLAFAYMVEAQDLYGCRVSNEIALAIKEHSQIFNTTPAKFGSKNFVRRIK
ncbi:hypothetical protein [Vibrio owensii]|uniref:hypothetical protein n=1 Tax=Vibrio owensii TaxID=696485 RepID=UPI0038CE8BAD